MNPSPRSPKDVTADPDYEVMSGYFRGHYWPWADEIVVRHKATGTFWKAVYAVRADDSDYEMQVQWKEMHQETITTIRYVPI